MSLQRAEHLLYHHVSRSYELVRATEDIGMASSWLPEVATALRHRFVLHARRHHGIQMGAEMPVCP